MTSKQTMAVLTTVCVVVVAVQFIPVRESLSNFRQTRTDLLVSYGQPLPVITAHTTQNLTTKEETELGTYVSRPAVAVNIGVLCILVGGVWFVICRSGVRLRWRVIVGLIVLLALGWCVLDARYRTYYRILQLRTLSFMDNAITQVSQWTSNPSWIERERATLRERALKDPGHDIFIADHIVLMNNGDWIAYCQGCTKVDPTVGDVFIGRGSDGKWYYTECHFCIDMLVAYWYAPYADLKAFVGQQTFNFTVFDAPPRAESLYQGGWFEYRQRTPPGGRRVVRESSQ